MLSGVMVWRIGFVSVIILAGVFGLFEWQVRRGVDFETARTTAVNTLVAIEMAYLFSARHRFEPALGRTGIRGIRPALIAVALTILLQLGFTYWPPMQRLFGTRDLDGTTWLVITATALAGFALVELEKVVLRRMLR